MLVVDMPHSLERFMNDEAVQKQIADALDVLCLVASEAAEYKGFHEDEKRLFEILPDDTPPDLIDWLNGQLLQAELGRQASEIGEAIEAVRKPKADDHLPQYSNFLVEEADEVIRVADTCGKRKLGIGQVVVDKLLYNLNRPHKHGKRS